jgi:hypothetical protein
MQVSSSLVSIRALLHSQSQHNLSFVLLLHYQKLNTYRVEHAQYWSAVGYKVYSDKDSTGILTNNTSYYTPFDNLFTRERTYHRRKQ